MNALYPLPLSESFTGSATRFTYFPSVAFHSALGSDVVCEMTGTVATVGHPEGGGPDVLMGEVGAGSVVLNADELEALPGFTEFFSALWAAGLEKLNPPPPEPEALPAE